MKVLIKISLNKQHYDNATANTCKRWRFINIYNLRSRRSHFSCSTEPWSDFNLHSEKSSKSDHLDSGQLKPCDWHWPQTATESHRKKHADVSTLFITCPTAFIDINTDFPATGCKILQLPSQLYSSGKAITHRGYKCTQALHATFSFIFLSKNSYSKSQVNSKAKMIWVAILCACTMYFQSSEWDQTAWGRRWGRWGYGNWNVHHETSLCNWDHCFTSHVNWKSVLVQCCRCSCGHETMDVI